MHISLDAALQRQPLLSTVGDKLLPTFPGAAAAYSLRALNGDANDVVRVRRSGDADGTTNERDFTAEGVALELEDWVNGKLEDTLPADVDTAAAAYSLRKVRNAYSGNAVQIRRASDNVEVNVAFDSNGEVSNSSAISNVDESPDAGDTTATTLGEFLTEGGNQDATVVTWYDQSGNGYDLTQSTTGNQPKIAENGSLLTLAGKPTIKPDGSDDFLINENAAWDTVTSTNLSCMTVAEGTSLVNRILWGIGDSANEDADWLVGGGSVSGALSFRGNRVNSATASVSTSGALLLTALDVTGGDGFVNGTAIGSPSTAARNVTADRLVLFTRRGTSSLGTCTDQSMSEIIFYSSDQSANRFKIESNINNYYGIYTAAEDGFVEAWYDQSGNGNHAEQASTGLQPQIVNAGSYLGELDFDGVDDELKTGSISGLIDNVSHSIFAVAKYNAATSSYEAFVSAGYGITGTRMASVIGGDASARIWFGGDDQTTPTGGSITANTLYLLTKTYDGATISGHVDGGAANTASAVFDLDADENVIAIGGYGPAATAKINGKVSEAIIYLSDQSANRTAIESNIADEYGITLS